jgi:CRISPR-associated protein (TIGR02710 family)
MDIAPLHVKYRLRLQLQHVLGLHGYGEAGLLIGRFLESYDQSMTPEDSSTVRALRDVFHVLDTWDQFRWQDAMSLAKETLLQRQCPALMDWWKRVMRARQWSAQPDGTVRGDQFPGVTGYELVQDLILNAERRGMRGHYDDAVARLYRALELLAQTYILHELRLNPVGHAYRRANPHVPRHAYLDSQQRIIAGPDGRGVGILYSWIMDYENRNNIDGLGGTYADNREDFSILMHARNRSLLAHGFNPLSKERWELLQRTITSFVDLVLERSTITQESAPQQLPGCELLELPAYRGLFGTHPVPLSDV